MITSIEITSSEYEPVYSCGLYSDTGRPITVHARVEGAALRVGLPGDHVELTARSPSAPWVRADIGPVVDAVDNCVRLEVQAKRTGAESGWLYLIAIVDTYPDPEFTVLCQT